MRRYGARGATIHVSAALQGVTIALNTPDRVRSASSKWMRTPRMARQMLMQPGSVPDLDAWLLREQTRRLVRYHEPL